MSWTMMMNQGASSRFSGKYLAMFNFKFFFFLAGILASVKVSGTAGSQHSLEQPLTVPGQKGFNTFASSGSFHAFHELGFLTCSQVFISLQLSPCWECCQRPASTCQSRTNCMGTTLAVDPQGAGIQGWGPGQEDSCESPPLGRSCATYSLILWFCYNRTKK